jgi:uncharacterized protein
MQCFTYRSSKREGVYLYVAEESFLENLPEELKQVLGKPIFMLCFDLYPERQIAKVDAKKVIESIKAQGYFLRIDTNLEENNLLNISRKERGLAIVRNEKLV